MVAWPSPAFPCSYPQHLCCSFREEPASKRADLRNAKKRSVGPLACPGADKGHPGDNAVRCRNLGLKPFCKSVEIADPTVSARDGARRTLVPLTASLNACRLEARCQRNIVREGRSHPTNARSPAQTEIASNGYRKGNSNGWPQTSASIWNAPSASSRRTASRMRSRLISRFWTKHRSIRKPRRRLATSMRGRTSRSARYAFLLQRQNHAVFVLMIHPPAASSFFPSTTLWRLFLMWSPDHTIRR